MAGKTPVITKIEPVVPLIKPRLRVAAYARVSMETDRLMHSLSAQISYYSDLIQKNPEWEYAGVYADRFISGTSIEKRSEFQRMIADCEKGLINIILCKSISRFARNTVDLLNTIRHLKELGIEVRFEKEQVNTLSSDGEVMLTLLASFAEQESRSISENSKWGIRKRIQKGTIGTANKHILGYRFDDELQQYVIIPEEAETVRWMFRMFLEGLSFQKIADELNAAGIRTTLNNCFQEAGVRLLLYNEVYAGDALKQKYIMTDPISKIKVRNRGELPRYLYSDCHEAIIDRETYEKVKIEMQRRADMAHPVYFFTGLIRCENCGGYYSRRMNHSKGHTYINWACRYKLDKKNCKSINIREDRLIAACIETVGEDYEKLISSMSIGENGDIHFTLSGGEIRTWTHPPIPVRIPKLKRERTLPKHLFDGMIFCGICGRRYGRVISDCKDRHMYWRCRSKSGGPQTCDSVNYPNADIERIFCEVFGYSSFDKDAFKSTVSKITVQRTGSIDFDTVDGEVRHYEALKLRENINSGTRTAAFLGKIRCAHCGNLYSQYITKGKYVYWTCKGKRLAHVECTAINISDCKLRTIAAYVLGLDDFDSEVFETSIDYILAFTDGSLRFIYKDGSEKTWQKV